MRPRSLLFLKVDALRRLGLANIAAVGAYRIRLRLGIHPVQRLERSIAGSQFFRAPSATDTTLQPPSHWDTQSLYFGWWREPLGQRPPDWHRNPFTGQRVDGADRRWWELSDFNTGAGDIKTVWEASRFDWVLAFAQRACAGDASAVDRLNTWLADWCTQNPAYRGPNWKCGQEASIRVLHLFVAARLLGQLDNPEPDLIRLLEAHLARIYPTLGYAMGQDNNHGTSEAAAMFIGGHWLARGVAAVNAAHDRSIVKLLDRSKPERWAEAGRTWLENRVERLIEPDGGFSQQSVNYHRLMLDTVSMTELGRRWLGCPAFSERFYQRAAAATNWLRAMTDPNSGDAPNLGANDGANLLPLTDADYRDYRPAVQLASTLFTNQPTDHNDAEWDGQHLRWLGLETSAADSVNATDETHDLDTATRASADTAGSEHRADTGSSVFHARGYVVLKKGDWRILFRYPYHRFRPGHCDALHVDLWHRSVNLLRDAGSYSYNAEPVMSELFTGPVGHNTIQFDDRDPMPRVSRFLRGAWLTTDSLQMPDEQQQHLQATAGYRDWLGAQHQREVLLDTSGLRVVDTISGFQSHAVLRWRLAPGNWQLDGLTASCNQLDTDNTHRRHTLTIEASMPVQAIRIIEGWESRYYLEKTPVPILEVEIHQPGQLISQYLLAP